MSKSIPNALVARGRSNAASRRKAKQLTSGQIASVRQFQRLIDLKMDAVANKIVLAMEEGRFSADVWKVTWTRGQKPKSRVKKVGLSEIPMSKIFGLDAIDQAMLRSIKALNYGKFYSIGIAPQEGIITFSW